MVKILHANTYRITKPFYYSGRQFNFAHTIDESNEKLSNGAPSPVTHGDSYKIISLLDSRLDLALF